MAISETHNVIVLRPPPGVRFTIFGSDVHLEFQRGREKEVIEWLRNWIHQYIDPQMASDIDSYTSKEKELSDTDEVEDNNPEIKLTPKARQRVNDLIESIKSSEQKVNDHGKT